MGATASVLRDLRQKLGTVEREAEEWRHKWVKQRDRAEELENTLRARENTIETMDRRIDELVEEQKRGRLTMIDMVVETYQEVFGEEFKTALARRMDELEQRE